MSEPSREPRTNVTGIDIARWLRRGFLIALGMLLLGGGMFLTSRYTANRRLMRLAEDDGLISVSWKGPSFDWLRRIIGDRAEEALLCHPVGLTVGDAEQMSDERIRRLLGELSGLEHIEIHSRYLPSSCLEIIATRHHMGSLAFRLPTAISHDDARWLSRMPRLKHLEIWHFGAEPRENDWSWLKALPKLESLEMSMWGGASDRDVIALADCPASLDLSLSGEALSDETLNLLCDHPALRYLGLEGSNIRLHFPNGRKLPTTLQVLDLFWTAVDDDSLAIIADLPQLRRVGILGGSVTDKGLGVLAGLPSLQELQLSDLEGVTDAGMERLAQSKSLREVHVGRVHTTPRGLIHLMSIAHWSDIRFDGVQFNRKAGSEFHPPTLEWLEEFLSSRRQTKQLRRPWLRLE